jgi:hypothetical protein
MSELAHTLLDPVQMSERGSVTTGILVAGHYQITADVARAHAKALACGATR